MLKAPLAWIFEIGPMSAGGTFMPANSIAHRC
jgi:hypothetical protein